MEMEERLKPGVPTVLHLSEPIAGLNPGPCMLFSDPAEDRVGLLQGSHTVYISKELFERWCAEDNSPLEM